MRNQALTAFVTVIAAFMSTASFAQLTYTPAQLQKMVKAGKYPKQGASKTETKPMDFDVCVTTATQLIGAVKENYPTAMIADTAIFRAEKVWTNDGAMIVGCSKPDRALTLTMSPYAR